MRDRAGGRGRGPSEHTCVCFSVLWPGQSCLSIGANTIQALQPPL